MYIVWNYIIIILLTYELWNYIIILLSVFKVNRGAFQYMFFKNYIETAVATWVSARGKRRPRRRPPPSPLTLPTDQGANRPYSCDGPVMEIICPDLQKNII